MMRNYIIQPTQTNLQLQFLADKIDVAQKVVFKMFDQIEKRIYFTQNRNSI